MRKSYVPVTLAACRREHLVWAEEGAEVDPERSADVDPKSIPWKQQEIWMHLSVLTIPTPRLFLAL